MRDDSHRLIEKMNRDESRDLCHQVWGTERGKTTVGNNFELECVCQGSYGCLKSLKMLGF